MRVSRWITISLALLLVWAFSAQYTAQRGPAQQGPQSQQAPQAAQAPPPPVIRINVNLVQVDAIVTDSKGKPVTDLKAEDFEVFQDGKPQMISNFEFVDIKTATARGGAVAAPVPPRGGPPAPPLPTRGGLRPQQIRRTIAMVVDDLGLSFDSMAHVKDSLDKWVDNEMQPGDLVAVIRTSAGMGSLQQFTSDKRLLHASINLVRFHVGRIGSSSFAPLRGANPPGSVDTTTFDRELSQMYSVGSLGAIQYVVQGLRDVPGRKSLILFAEDMRLMFPDGRNQEVEDRLRRLSDAANRSSVVIYSVDPRGVINTGLSAEDNTNGMSQRQVSQVGGQRINQLILSREGMETLADKTGGLFVHDNNDVMASLREVVDDGNGYYLIGYHPDEATFRSEAGKFHPIRVRVNRPGLTVRSRTGFFGDPDRVTPPPSTPIAQITRALTSPFATGDVRMRLTGLFSHNDKQGSAIDALLYFDAHDLTFTTEADGTRTAQVDIAAVTFDAEGNQIEGADKTWRFRVPKESYQDVLSAGIVYSMHVPVKKAGPYQMRVVLRDSGSQRLGSATQFVEIPDVNKGRLALSGIVMAGEQSRAAGAVDLAEGQIAGKDMNSTPAVRIFTPGTAITYAYEIFNARNDRNKKPELEVQTRLFRDGQQVTAGPAAAPNSDGQQNTQRLISIGHIQLNQIPAGDYVLQVIVTDKLASEKNRIAAQSMDFEIQ